MHDWFSNVSKFNARKSIVQIGEGEHGGGTGAREMREVSGNGGLSRIRAAAQTRRE